MRRGMIVTLVLCGLLFTGTARASLEQMLGLWKNVDGDTRGITRLRIFTDRGGLQVQAWGKAHPNDTVMGPVPAQAYASSAGANLEQDAEAIFARMDNDFSVRRFVIHPDKFGRIAVGEMVLFTDRSGRTPYHNHYVFQRQAVITQPMPHPMPRPMPRPTLRPRPGRIPARVRPGLLRPGLQPLVTEDLIRFDWRKAKVKEIGGRYKIVVGSMYLKDFGSKRDEAWQALRIIRHYRLDRQGFVGRPDPTMEYYLSESGTPEGAYRGEDAIAFDPNRLAVEEIGGRFKIVEGSHWLMDFGEREDEARKALAIIRKHGFTHQCYVGRPDPSFVYFRK